MGRRPPRLDGPLRRRHRRRVPRARQRRSASSTCRAIPTGPGSTTSTGPSSTPRAGSTEHDLTGKVVAVVGTGSSATQVVPAIQPIVQQLYVFQREPGWVMPKGERDFTDERARRVRATRGGGGGSAGGRSTCWRRACGAGISTGPAPRRTRPAGSSASTTSTRQFADRPDLREAVTPKYPYPGKRPIFASTFYPALKKDNVELVPQAVASVTRDRHRRRRRRRARRRRHRDGDRLPARELPRAPARRRPRRSNAPGALGGRAARVPRHHRARRSRTSSCSTGRAPTAARS